MQGPPQEIPTVDQLAYQIKRAQRMSWKPSMAGPGWEVADYLLQHCRRLELIVDGYGKTLAILNGKGKR